MIVLIFFQIYIILFSWLTISQNFTFLTVVILDFNSIKVLIQNNTEKSISNQNFIDVKHLTYVFVLIYYMVDIMQIWIFKPDVCLFV